MTGFFLLLAAIVLVLAIIAVLLGRLSDGQFAVLAFLGDTCGLH